MKFPRKSAWIADLRHPEGGWRAKRNSPLSGCGPESIDCNLHRVRLDKSKEGGGGLINGLARIERNEIIYKRTKIFFQFQEKVESVSSVGELKLQNGSI